MAVNDIGKWLIIFGVILVILGAAFILAGKIPWLGKLPGDIYIQRRNFTFFFPLTTSILLSVLLSLLLSLFSAGNLRRQDIQIEYPRPGKRHGSALSIHPGAGVSEPRRGRNYQTPHRLQPPASS